jgi:hypothetical protein
VGNPRSAGKNAPPGELTAENGSRGLRRTLAKGFGRIRRRPNKPCGPGDAAESNPPDWRGDLLRGRYNVHMPFDRKPRVRSYIHATLVDEKYHHQFGFRAPDTAPTVTLFSFENVAANVEPAPSPATRAQIDDWISRLEAAGCIVTLGDHLRCR